MGLVMFVCDKKYRMGQDQSILFSCVAHYRAAGLSCVDAALADGEGYAIDG
jgi:hypothetical protein